MILKNILIINPFVGKIGPNTFLNSFLSRKPLNVDISVTIIYPYPDIISQNLESLGCKIIYNKFIVLNHYNNFFIKIIRRILGEIVLSLIYIKLMWKEKFNLSLLNTELYSFSLIFLNSICPIYVMVHSLSFKNSGFFAKVVFFIQKKFVKKYLAVSFSVKNALSDFNINKNVFVTYNGVSTPFIQKMTISRPFKIISVIHPVPHKGAHFLVDALADLNKLKLDFEWTLIGWDIKTGNQKYANDICRRIENLNLGEKVKILGSIDYIHDLYSSSDLLVHPSLSEAFGFVITEAMSYCLPVIAFNVGALPEIIENGKSGYLIEPFDIKDMTKKIQYFVNNQNLLIEFGKYGRSVVETKFEINKNIEKVYSVLELL